MESSQGRKWFTIIVDQSLGGKTYQLKKKNSQHVHKRLSCGIDNIIFLLKK